jgi:hypothetical protein
VTTISFKGSVVPLKGKTVFWRIITIFYHVSFAGYLPQERKMIFFVLSVGLAKITDSTPAKA